MTVADGRRNVCSWIEDSDGTWETQCDHYFVVMEGTPAENGFRFCCYCGGELFLSPFDETDEEVEGE